MISRKISSAKRRSAFAVVGVLLVTNSIASADDLLGGLGGADAPPVVRAKVANNAILLACQNGKTLGVARLQDGSVVVNSENYGQIVLKPGEANLFDSTTMTAQNTPQTGSCVRVFVREVDSYLNN